MSDLGVKSSGTKVRVAFAFVLLVALALLSWMSVRGASPANASDLLAGQGFLPDNRGWEMVSPQDKNGGNIVTSRTQNRVASDGNAVTFRSPSIFADASGSTGGGAEYMAIRGEDGWQSHVITPLQSTPVYPTWSSNYVGIFSDDLDRGVFHALSPIGDTPHPNVDEAANLFLASGLRDPDAKSFELASDSVAPVAPRFFNDRGRIAFADVSSDFSHIAFEDPDNLTSDATGGQPKAYEYVNGQVRLAGILPDSECGTPPCPASQSVIGGGRKVQWSRTETALSEDGARLYFTAPPFSDPSTQGVGNAGIFPGTFGTVYLREDGVSVNIAESERSTPDPAGTKPAMFLYAIPDGSQAFFSSREQLTDEDTDDALDLYRYDVDADPGTRLTLITHDQEPSDDAVAPSAHVLNVLGTSDDGSYVYFVGRPTKLISGQADWPDGVDDGDGENGDRVIWVWHSGELRVVGVTASSHSQPIGDDRGSPMPAAWVSPDGRHLMFYTDHISMDAYADADNVGGYDTPYLYDYDADQTRCVSCVEGASVANSPFNPAKTTGASLQQTSGPAMNPPPLSEDGRYAYFSSPAGLVPEDTNGRFDAYQFDASSGKLSLISSGNCSCDSYFVVTDRTGKNVFFTTTESLVQADGDGNVDLYDARVDGGIPAQNETLPAECQGDDCQNDPSGPPVSEEPGSSSHHGPGNQADPDCRSEQQRVNKLKHKIDRLRAKAKRAKGKHAKQLRKKAKKTRRGLSRATRTLQRCQGGVS